MAASGDPGRRNRANVCGHGISGGRAGPPPGPLLRGRVVSGLVPGRQSRPCAGGRVGVMLAASDVCVGVP